MALLHAVNNLWKGISIFNIEVQFRTVFQTSKLQLFISISQTKFYIYHRAYVSCKWGEELIFISILQTKFYIYHRTYVSCK